MITPRIPPIPTISNRMSVWRAIHHTIERTFAFRTYHCDMNTRNFFASILMLLVVAVIVVALLGIWGIIDWSYVRHYFWKSFLSLVVIVLGSLVIYLIQSIFKSNEPPKFG